MSGFSACPMCGQSIHAHDPDVCRRRWQADTVAASEAYSGTPHVTEPRPFAKTYECEPPDHDPYKWVCAVSISDRDGERIKELHRGAACITGEVVITVVGGQIQLSLDSYTVFA